jgi:ubiquitin carboxyl-terminal hydrolase 34
MERLFTTYLFPDLSQRPEKNQVVEPCIPVMHNVTRQEIYNVLILLCEDQVNCGEMLKLLEDVISQGMDCSCRYILFV